MAIQEHSLTDGDMLDGFSTGRPGGKRGQKRPQYTDQDDALVVTRLSAAKAAGSDMDAAIMALADEMGRPESGVKSRWMRLQRELKKSGAEDQAMALIQKLKNRREDRGELKRERDAYKLKYEKEEHEHRKTQRDLSALKNKYEVLVAELAAVAMDLED